VAASSVARSTFTRLPFSSPRNICPPRAPQQKDRSLARKAHARRLTSHILGKRLPFHRMQVFCQRLNDNGILPLGTQAVLL
jgi:hypothetical protein